LKTVMAIFFKDGKLSPGCGDPIYSGRNLERNPQLLDEERSLKGTRLKLVIIITAIGTEGWERLLLQ